VRSLLPKIDHNNALESPNLRPSLDSQIVLVAAVMGRGMAKISSKAACIAVAALLMGVGVGLLIDIARAQDTCAIAPGAAAPKGQHWYYHIDRVQHRKCWYLHATMPLPSRAAAEPPAAHSDPATPVAAPQSPSAAKTTNAASTLHEPETISNPPSGAAGTQPAPHVTELKVKTANAPLAAATAATEPPAPEQTDEASAPQISRGDADAKPASAAKLAAAPAASAAAHAVPLSSDAEATNSPRTQSSYLVFLLAALALGIAAALIALSGRMAGKRRAPRLSRHPDGTWRSYDTPDQRAGAAAVMHQDDAPFLAPQAPYVAVDLDAPELFEEWSPVQPDFAAARRQDEEPPQPGQVGLTRKDIEMALRILRQPGQGAVRRAKGAGTQSG
jgi:hypothetical protein